MATEKTGLKRKEIFSFFEGVNSLIGSNLFKAGEMSLALNARSTTIGVAEKRAGFTRLGSDITATANYGIFFYNEPVSGTNLGMYRVSTVAAATSIYYLNNSSVWTALINKGTGLTALQFSYTFAEKCCFLCNGTDNNRYISENGTTVVDSDTDTGHLFGSPKAKKIKFFKDRLYLADYTVGSANKKNSVMFSSKPVGIVALVDGDHSDIQVGDSISVTDTKYIHAADTLDIYRGNEIIAQITTSRKTESTIVIASIDSYASSSASASPSASSSPSASLSPSSSVSLSPSISLSASLSPSASTSPSSSASSSVSPSPIEVEFLSSDEVWVDATYNADKVFRWANNENSGVDVKQYDYFNLGGNSDSRIKMMETIGDVMMIGTNDNLAVWDDYRLKSFDLGVGCVSDNGYVKSLGSLFFLGYNGIFQTSGGMPKLISAKVEKYIEGASKAGLEAAAMGKKGNSIFCSLGTVTLYHPDGSEDMTLSNVVLEFCLRTQNWTVHSGIKATEFVTYIASDNVDSLIFASTEAKHPLMELFSGETDNGSEIPFRVDSSNISLLKEFEKISYIHEVIIESERGSNIQCFVSLDSEPFYEIEGTARKGATIMKVTNKDGDHAKPPRCRTIKVSIRDFSKQICKLSKVALTFAPSNEEEAHRE